MVACCILLVILNDVPSSDSTSPPDPLDPDAKIKTKAKPFDESYLCLLLPPINRCFRYKLHDMDPRGFKQYGCCKYLKDYCAPHIMCYLDDYCGWKSCVKGEKKSHRRYV